MGPHRLWGSSYGGLLTVYALLKRPGVFAAGVAGAPAVDPHAFGPDDVAITRTPGHAPEAFVRGSALTHRIRPARSLLIIHGLMDDVVPFRTTMALAERLMLLGKDFDLATAPAATHALDRARALRGVLLPEAGAVLRPAPAAPISRSWTRPVTGCR
jgi:dipeptidyl-peptidase 4